MGFERRLLGTIQWTLATNLVSPQRSESVLLNINICLFFPLCKMYDILSL